MRALIAVLRNDDYVRAFESDLMRFYGIDIRDLWRPRSGLTYPRAARLLWCVVRMPDGMLSRHLRPSPLTQEQSTLLDILDQLNALRYLVTPVAMSKVSKESRMGFLKAIPKPIVRPKNDNQPEQKKKIEFTPPSQVKAQLNNIIMRRMMGL